MSDVDFALAEPHPLGKCTAEMKVSLPDEVDDMVGFLAVAHGMSKSAYAREVLTEHCLGKAAVVRLRVQRPLRQSEKGA